MREAQESKSKTQDLADRAAMWLTIVALGGGALTFAAWLALGEPLAFAMERAVTVMVIACPHALGLAIPLVVAVSTALGAGSGLLVRNRMAFENARLIDAVVFDKTGTLTLGRFGVERGRAASAAPCPRRAARRSPASVEELSEHPIARAIADAAPAKRGVDGLPSDPRQGRRGARRTATASRSSAPATSREPGSPCAEDDVTSLSAGGRTVVFVLVDGDRGIGAIALSDIVRPESAEAVRASSEMGIEPIMLTGDNARSWPSGSPRELGIERFFAEVLPAEKAATVQRGRAPRARSSRWWATA